MEFFEIELAIALKISLDILTSLLVIPERTILQIYQYEVLRK